MGDNFGYSVAVSGDTVVVGAGSETAPLPASTATRADNSAGGSGAAYVFVRDGTTWTQQAYLKASNTGANDRFGHSVALSGDTVVVGASQEASAATGVDANQADNSAGGSGAAYVFVRDGTTWTQQAYLKASNTGAGDQFGFSVAVSGDNVVVGANVEDSAATGVNGNQADNSASFAGAAYVFVRDGTTWTQQAYLKASNTGAGDQFGFSVAVSGHTVVVAAHLEDSDATGVDGNQADNSAGNAGAAYVFIRDGTTWTQQAYLKASNAGANDNFGYSIAVSVDTVVVGARGEDSAATGVNGNQADNNAEESGAAYLFQTCRGAAGTTSPHP
ncbi:MAG: FG-GAP repeat protein [Gammaproteobacteria bacterium]|nr:FG-GAP repeat protein [Gammaproteobacteria bacterium]